MFDGLIVALQAPFPTDVLQPSSVPATVDTTIEVPGWGTFFEAACVRNASIEPPLGVEASTCAVEVLVRLGPEMRALPPGSCMTLLSGRGVIPAIDLLHAEDGIRLLVSAPASAGGAYCCAERAVVPVGRWVRIAAVVMNGAVMAFVDDRLVGRRNPCGASRPLHELQAPVAFSGQLAALRVWDRVPLSMRQAVIRAERNGTGEIESRYLSLSGPDGVLGAPLAPEKVLIRSRPVALGASRQPFIVSSISHLGSLGECIPDVGDHCPIRFRIYQRGCIYWSAGLPTRVVHGRIYRWYQTLGGPTGALGVPMTDQCMMGNIAICHFESGAIYDDGRTTIDLCGDAYLTYLEAGGDTGPLGLPIAPAANIAGGIMHQFERGSIYCKTPGTGSKKSAVIVRRGLRKCGATVPGAGETSEVESALEGIEASPGVRLGH